MNLQIFIKDGQNHPISHVQTDLDLVREIQHHLARLGFNPGATNGIWNPKTQDALTRFKAAHQLFSNDFTVRLAQALLQPQPVAARSPVMAAKASRATATSSASQPRRPVPPPPPSRLQSFVPLSPPAPASSPSVEQRVKSRINSEGLNIIKECEGLKLEAILCLVGVPVIGYSSIRGVRLGQTITEKDAEVLLLKDLQKFEAMVDRLVNVPLSNNQFSALVSFVFNVGYSAFKSSTLLTRLNQGDYEGAGDQFLRWDNANGKFWPELNRRRQLERALFLH